MADPNDVAAAKIARREFVKRKVDLMLADLRVSHGVCYVRGTVSAERGSNIGDLKAEMELIARILRAKPEFRDVVLDCRYKE
jgi:hypothetical protein